MKSHTNIKQSFQSSKTSENESSFDNHSAMDIVSDLVVELAHKTSINTCIFLVRTFNAFMTKPALFFVCVLFIVT